MEEVKESENVSPVDDVAVCWICAEPVKYYSLPECNHRICHVCSLRLRALYKKMDCTFCKEPQPVVIFTESADMPFSSFTPESIEFKDAKLNIYFETQEMMEETLLLLRFNCPDPTCDYIGSSWSNLKLHVRATHGKLMCDLCIRSKKVFAHEHVLYPPNHLSVHLPSSSHRPPRNLPKEKDVEGGVHPLCEFCRECFFGSDELYAHMRERHEECFLCKRNEVKDQYFLDYESLERHFNTAHFPCNQPSCQAQKFVVFNSAIDLKAHTVEQHGGEMSTRDKRDLLRVQADFEFERGGRRPPDREREQEPPPGPSNAAARRRQAFGGNLTSDGPPAPNGGASNPNATSHRRSPEPPRTDVDPATLERQSQFISRLQNLAPNPSSAVPAVKAAIRGYRAHEESARGLISTVWTVLGERLEPTASVINALVDFLEEEENKQELLASWKGFEIEQRREFPDLTPTVAGSGYSGIASGRVLNIKHATGSRSSHQSSRQVWDRVAQAASSSTMRTPPPKPVERFPALQASSSSTPAPARQTGQRVTPWSASARGAAPPPTTSTRPGPSTSSKLSQPRPPPPKLNEASFPGLPSSTNTRVKPTVSGNTSLKNILGVAAAPAQPAWATGGGAAPNDATPVEVEDAPSGGAGGKGKKGKGKQKQTLFTLGSFPT